MFSSQSGGGVGCILGLKVGVEILKNQEKTRASLWTWTNRWKSFFHFVHFVTMETAIKVFVCHSPEDVPHKILPNLKMKRNKEEAMKACVQGIPELVLRHTQVVCKAISNQAISYYDTTKLLPVFKALSSQAISFSPFPEDLGGDF